MNIEIKGVQFVNKGAELMLHAVLQQLSTLAPDADVVLRPNKGSPYAKRAELGAYQKLTLTKSFVDLNFMSYWLPNKFRGYLKNRWGIITEADINITLDASGFAYGDQWTSIALRQLSKEVSRYHQKNKVYIFLPQALGPFTREQDRQSLSDSLPKAALIVAREQSSFDNVKGLGVDDRVLKQFPDFTNLVKGQCPDYFDSSRPVFLLIPNSKMLSRKNHDAVWHSKYLELLVSSIRSAQQRHMRVVVLNHEGVSDQKVCDRLLSELGSEVVEPIEIINEQNPIYVKGIIGRSALVLCSRFHGCVSALSQGVPCLGTSWSYKYERLFEDYRRSEFLIKAPLTTEQLDRLMSQALAVKPATNRARILELKAHSTEMWQSVKQVLRDAKLDSIQSDCERAINV